ncbi:hypothetical protein Catovirus_2_3 [Catovirus CTV1]|uniref:Uncharacterized protein n=1 Tax=Catovirus CTV1 TaxID=1977631 RepID=A0A1V0SBK7_9VIRU|nr:hypothetical protein Catovirus_2_3 [Catovirus CTV1]
MKYNCDICNYSTENRNSWYAHKKSKLHEKNSKDKPINTDEIKPKIINEKPKKTDEIELLKQKIEDLERENKEMKYKYDLRIESLNNCIDILKQNDQFQQKVINSSQEIVKNSVSIFSRLTFNSESNNIDPFRNYINILNNMNIPGQSDSDDDSDNDSNDFRDNPIDNNMTNGQ